ncbi:MAG: outer membrane protein assembly factor BamB, partial [Planctomycetota bacterium]
EVWRLDDLGPSYSGPVADSERVFTTSTEENGFEVVRALDRATGKELWRHQWSGAMTVPFFAASNGSWIRSTPTLDEGHLYVAGMRDVLQCLKAESGEVLWSVDFTERFESDLPPFGCVCSPMVIGDALVIQAGAAVVMLNKITGATIWRAMVDDGDMMSAGAFSSPIRATIAGREQLIVQSRTALAGLDIQSGEALWSTPVKAFRGMNILTPIVRGDSVFTSTYGGRSQLFAIEVDDDGLMGVTPSWNAPVQGYMSSPVVIDDHAYIFGRNNRFACVDLERGEEKWTSSPTGDSYWSLAYQGDRILALSDTGRLRMLKATPSGYEVIQERDLVNDQSWAHIAPVGNQLFVRAQESLIAFEWQKP